MLIPSAVITKVAAAVPDMVNGTLITTPPGAGSRTVPAGVTSITIEIWGAGGAGTDSEGDGGGGGAYCKRNTKAVTPGDVISFYIGKRTLGTTPSSCDGMSAGNGGPISATGGVASGGDVNTNGGAGSSATGSVFNKTGGIGGSSPNGGAGGSGGGPGDSPFAGAGVAPGGGGGGGGTSGTGNDGANGGIKFTF